MSKIQKVKQFICAEFTKLKAMDGKDRLWYIWEYYKFHISITVFALVCLVSILCSVFSPEEAYLQNATINLISISGQEDALSTDFHQAAGLGKYDTVSANTLYLAYDEGYGPEDYATVQSLQVMVAAKELDLIFLPQSDFEALAPLDIYTDLQQLLPEDLWELVKEHAIYVTDPESGAQYPGALDVTEVPAIQNCDYLTESVVVFVSPTTQRLDHCITMLRYLLCV